MPKKKRPKLWSVARIKHPKHPSFTARVTELSPGGNLYAVRMKKGKQKMTSLKRTRADLGTTAKAQEQAARALAFDLIAELAELGEAEPAKAEALEGPFTLRRLTVAYEARGFFGRSDHYRRCQRPKLRRVTAFLGEDREVTELRPSDVAAYTAHRETNDAVRQGTIHSDLMALKIALNWAMDERLLAKSPLARVKLVHEKAPRRPWATREDYEKLKSVADELPPAFETVLDLAWATGRRISAILRLRWRDIGFDTSNECPNGLIKWYAGERTTNKAHEQVVLMSPLAQETLKRWLKQSPGIGSAPVFPDVVDPSKPLAQWRTFRWLGKAEQLAGLEHKPHGGWHAFRRGWATQRKHMPLVDVAEVGGWRDTTTLVKSYQHSDPATQLAVVNGPF